MNKTRLDRLKMYITEQGWQWGAGKPIPYGEQILVSKAGTTVIVNFWPKRGKMMVQGGNSALKTALQTWVDGDMGQTTDKVEIKPITGPHIGMDESGKGDWFGPVTVAAVYLDEQMATTLSRLGVRDSKKIAASRLEYLAGQIERVVPPAYRHVLVLDPETYNEQYALYDNMNILLAHAYGVAVQPVWQETQATKIVCDQFSKRTDRLESVFANHKIPKPSQQPRAESVSVAVAAASILATDAFTTALWQLGEVAGLDGPLPKGASDKQNLEMATHHIIQFFGVESLNRFAKLNFRSLRKFLE